VRKIEIPYPISRPVRKIKISLPSRSSGKENQDILTNVVAWNGISRLPYQTGRGPNGLAWASKTKK